MRKAMFAGHFYPESKEEIEELLNYIYEKEKNKINTELSSKKIIGGVVPHAGYIFSGYEAIHYFELIKKSNKVDTFIIITPNHRGYGPEIASDEARQWSTPLGIVDLDLELLKEINIPSSALSHKFEHSGEVMLPFLQYFLNYPFKIVPISINRQNFENSKKIAIKIFEAVKKLNKNISIIASSDFSHYVPPKIGETMDDIALKEILNLNSENLEKVVLKNNLSICGFGPIMALIEYSKLITKNPKVNILRRGHSGEIKPSDEVVDYISILFTEN